MKKSMGGKMSAKTTGFSAKVGKGGGKSSFGKMAATPACKK